MTEIDFVPVTRAGTERFAMLLEHADLDAPVPSCSDWKVRDLADHLGGVHQWAVHAIVHNNPNGQPSSAPSDREGLIAWYRASAGLLLDTLNTTPIDAEAWHFGPEPQQAGWWRRRQAHEITMHLHDLQLAMDGVETIDPVLAADGVNEVRQVFFPRQVRLKRMPPLERSLAMVVVETGERYVFMGDGTVEDASIEDVAIEATVTGPAEALLLALWHRIGPDDPRLVITGDRSAAEAVLSERLTA